MICYGEQQPPVPGTKATFLDGHAFSEPDSILSDASSQLSSMAKSHYNNNYIVKESLIQKQNFLTTVTNTTNTSASSADENQNTKYLKYLGENIQSKNSNNGTNGNTADRPKQLQLSVSLQYDQSSQRLSIYISHGIDLGKQTFVLRPPEILRSPQKIPKKVVSTPPDVEALLH
uniref:Uncharacterized protein n=1 Tax=Romanomermis culicivorax TaxID=13658 RepID=A0A915IY50_ROMCU